MSPARHQARVEPVERDGGTRASVVTPLLAVGMLLLTTVVSGAYDLGIRDPDGIIGRRIVLVLGVVAIAWLLDVVPRAIRSGSDPRFIDRLRRVSRTRWTWRRMGVVIGSIVAFYVVYLCYRNLKSIVPIARPGLHDFGILQFERSVFGTNPGEWLQGVLGTGIAAEILSVVYISFLLFVPVSIALALVWSRDGSAGLWWVAALSLNWILGALSYYLLPAVGPVYAFPELFLSLPDTGVTALQASLAGSRDLFLTDPRGGGGLQGVAAFASLHVSIVFTGALVATLLGLHLIVRVAMWIFLALTAIATVYFGWHYVVDVVAGLLLGLAAVYGGARLTGYPVRCRREAAGE